MLYFHMRKMAILFLSSLTAVAVTVMADSRIDAVRAGEKSPPRETATMPCARKFSESIRGSPLGFDRVGTDRQPEDLPRSYGVLLFQAFESLDVFGPLDALQNLARSYQMDLALISSTLNPVSTKPRSPSMNPKNSTVFQSVVPTHTLETAPPLDVLIVPGGVGTRAPDINSTIDWIANTYPTLKYLITVCTGAGLAAQAGVLDCKRATTNKAAWASTVRLGPKVN